MTFRKAAKRMVVLCCAMVLWACEDSIVPGACIAHSDCSRGRRCLDNQCVNTNNMTPTDAATDGVQTMDVQDNMDTALPDGSSADVALGDTFVEVSLPDASGDDTSVPDVSVDVQVEPDALTNFCGEISTVGTAVFVGMTTGSSNSTSPSCVSGATGSPDIHFFWTPPSSGQYSFTLRSTSGNGYDPVMNIYQGCNRVSELACNDDGGGIGLSSRISLPVSVGMVYELVADGLAGTSGQFAIDIVPL